MGTLGLQIFFGSRSGPHSASSNAAITTRDPVVEPNGIQWTFENHENHSYKGPYQHFQFLTGHSAAPGLLASPYSLTRPRRRARAGAMAAASSRLADTSRRPVWGVLSLSSLSSPQLGRLPPYHQFPRPVGMGNPLLCHWAWAETFCKPGQKPSLRQGWTKDSWKHTGWVCTRAWHPSHDIGAFVCMLRGF